MTIPPTATTLADAIEFLCHIYSGPDEHGMVPVADLRHALQEYR